MLLKLPHKHQQPLFCKEQGLGVLPPILLLLIHLVSVALGQAHLEDLHPNRLQVLHGALSESR